MAQDFMYGWDNDYYGERDLMEGTQHANDLVKFQRLKKEPFHHYDLKKFIEWAEGRLVRLRGGA